MSPDTLLTNLLARLKQWQSSSQNILNTFAEKQYPQKITALFRVLLKLTGQRLAELRLQLHHFSILSAKFALFAKVKIMFAAHNAALHGLRLFNTSRKTLKHLFNLAVLQADAALTLIDKRALQLQMRFGAGTEKLALKTTAYSQQQRQKLHAAYQAARQTPRVQKLKQYALLIRLDKPIGTLLVLWPTLIALWIAAGGWPDTDVLLVFVAGVFLMRSAGCAINDYADRHIDRHVRRTQHRPLTAGKISEKETLIIFATLSICAFLLVLLMNPLTIVMSFIGLALAASYPYMKRHHYLPQVHLGAAFGWAVPMAYAAQTNELSPVTWLLFIATVLWATAYDTMYAMVDREDDLKIGVKSTAILFESADKLIIGIIQALLILCLIMIGRHSGLGGFYYAGVLVASYLAIWQQYLIRHRQPAQCFQAFLNNNWFGFALFAGVFLEYQLGGITS